jgi:hypothetical protein
MTKLLVLTTVEKKAPHVYPIRKKTLKLKTAQLILDE